MQTSFLKYLALRLATAALAVVGGVVLLLSLTLLIPGSPAAILLGPRATPELIAALNVQMGLDLPLPQRLFEILRRSGPRRSWHRHPHKPAGAGCHP